ncbi:MAG: hypothetical protein ACR5K2_04860 [Wolbachia sp.]
MGNINFLKFIESCFKTMMPRCGYNDYQYVKVIKDRIEAANIGKIRRIIFNMPPCSMKSMCVSIVLSTCGYWVNQPTA